MKYAFAPGSDVIIPQSDKIVRATFIAYYEVPAKPPFNAIKVKDAGGERIFRAEEVLPAAMLDEVKFKRRADRTARALQPILDAWNAGCRSISEIAKKLNATDAKQVKRALRRLRKYNLISEPQPQS